MLGAEDGAWAVDAVRGHRAGTFEHGTSVLQLRSDPDDAERLAPLPRAAARRAAHARAARPATTRWWRPGTAWPSPRSPRPGACWTARDLVDGRRARAELLVGLHWDADRRLARISRGGVVGHRAAGVLEDYADLAEGLLALYQVTGEGAGSASPSACWTWSSNGSPTARGGFYDTAADADALFRRPQDPTDNVTPSGASATANALLTLGALTGDASHLAGADSALATLLPLARRAPRFAGWAWSAITARLAGPVQVAVALPAGAGDPGLHGRALHRSGLHRSAPQRSALHRIALGSTSPGLVVAVAEEGRWPSPCSRIARPSGGVPLRTRAAASSATCP